MFLYESPLHEEGVYRISRRQDNLRQLVVGKGGMEPHTPKAGLRQHRPEFSPRIGVASQELTGLLAPLAPGRQPIVARNQRCPHMIVHRPEDVFSAEAVLAPQNQEAVWRKCLAGFSEDLD